MTDETFDLFDIATKHFATSRDTLSFGGMHISAMEWGLNQGSRRKFHLLQAKIKRARPAEVPIEVVLEGVGL